MTWIDGITVIDQKRTNLDFKLTLQASQIEPELGTAQPQFVWYDFTSKCIINSLKSEDLKKNIIRPEIRFIFTIRYYRIRNQFPKFRFRPYRNWKDFFKNPVAVINNFGTYVRIGFLFNLLKLTYVEFQYNKRISIRTEVLDGKTCQRKNKVCGTYVRIDFLCNLLKLTHVEFQ